MNDSSSTGRLGDEDQVSLASSYNSDQLDAIPWATFGMQQAHLDGLEKQLFREVSEGHLLYGRTVKPIARASGSDDVLFEVFDSSKPAANQVAMVHLTWTLSGADTPPYPLTTIHESLDAWLQNVTESRRQEELSTRSQTYWEDLNRQENRNRSFLFPVRSHLVRWLVLFVIASMLLAFVAAVWIAGD